MARKKPIEKWYLAGPFFNPVQLQLIKDIEAVFLDKNVPFFSPRLCSENEKKGPLTQEDAITIFDRNVDNIEDCTHLLAVIDWKLPEGHQIVPVEEVEHLVDDEGPLVQCEISGPSLNIPDSGTVFEMGLAHAAGKPICLFTTRPPTEKINVMLIQAAAYVARSLDELRLLLDGKLTPYPQSQEAFE